ncbi:MAG: alpha/beta hydrolase [Gammaproteobacteria bacterium]|nr:alpha/beta hydrolase [Gammaproteobacteria bacterium]MBU1441026.1 alpha/beta hydrolase [Gammaproteobacteria bacterium]
MPGLMNDERVWSPIVAALDDRRHIRIAATHRHASVDESAREAIAVMPPGRFAVAGFSLGGYVALEVCRQARERIAGLGLLDTGARADADDAKQARIRMVQALGAGTATFEQIAAGFAGRLLHPSHLNDPDLLALLADMARAVGGDGFARQQQAAMNRADQRGLLEELRVPALVLCGREDQVTPVALSKEMAGLLPDAELVIVERSGHMATLEQPEAVVEAVVRWLDVVDGRLRR